MVCIRLPSFQSLPNLHVHTASTYNVNVERCGMCMCFRNKGRDRVEKGFHFQLFQKVRGEAYRSWYTYFSNLVARRLEATSAQENEWVRG